MTKKHYEAIAKVIKQNLPPENCFTTNASIAYSTLTTIAEELAELFAQDNPRFQRIKFLVACGINP